MLRLLVSGLGNIGYRHIEALCKLDEEIELYVHSRYPESMQRAAALFASLGRDKEKCFMIPRLSAFYIPVDAAILSGNSNERFGIFETIVRNHITSNIILEKIAFNQKEQYRKALALIQEHGLKVWVNHSLRYLQALEEIKEEVSRMKARSFEVSGDFGLACNITHWLDLFACVTGDCAAVLDGSGLNEGTVPCKRDGYVEFSGAVQGMSHGGRKIVISNADAKGGGTILRFARDSRHFLEMNLSRQTYKVVKKDAGTERAMKVEYQSSLSQRYVQDIQLTGDCRLPGFHEIYDMNLLVLALFSDKLKLGSDCKCNIT